MALRVDLETPTWRYRSWLRPLEGVLLALFGGFGSLCAVAGLLGLDGADNAVHLDTVQHLVVVLTAVCGFILFGVTALQVMAISPPTVVASSQSGLALVGRIPLCIPWGVLKDVRLETHRGKVTPVLLLRSGGVIQIVRGRSRVSPGTVSVIEANLGNPDAGGLPVRRAVEIARALRGQLREVGGLLPAPSGSSPSQISYSQSELPGTPSFRRRSLGLSSPQARPALFVSIALIIVGLVGAQDGAGHPFNGEQFSVALAWVLVSTVVLVLCVSFFATAELAIGPGWIARRRKFHRRWSVLSTERLVSVRSRFGKSQTRRGFRGSTFNVPGLLLMDESRRQILVSWIMLRSGASGPLQTELSNSPALLPSARLLLTGNPGPAPQVPAFADPGSRTRRAYAQIWGLLLSAGIVTGVAVTIAAVHHALWVILPAVASVASLAWAVVLVHRQRRSMHSLGNPDMFHSAQTAPKRAPLIWALSLGQVALVATVVCTSLVSTASSASASFEIAEAPGYYTYSGASGKPLEQGEPWGSFCQPIVFLAKDLPEKIYQEAQGVIRAARTEDLDVTIDDNHGTWYPADLYPPGLTSSGVTFVPIFPDSTSTPKLSGGKPEHIQFGWDARPDSTGNHEILIDLQATLYLKNIGNDTLATARSIRQLIAFAEGVSNTTVAGSAIATGSTDDEFTQKDMAAMHSMSGCPG